MDLQQPALPISSIDPQQPALPISSPLTSLEQLMDDSVFSSFQFPFQRSSVPLMAQKDEKKSKLLVCHDMKGGYQDDRFVQGDANYDAYSLWHWQCIDVFVYFSHYLVTVPPPCWINAAHRHGVRVLGTFITEWEKGAQTCKLLLESENSARMYASRLAKVASKFGFDGWLLNIENTVSAEHIDTLILFISELTKMMHELVPSSLVIWYDAVTVDGVLRWQNMLTEKNKWFFDACDGIFINYTWKENYAQNSANMAGDRASDVYMGVDVFGRNTFGGGGFQSDIALNVALKAGVSAALFAPAWVYEENIGPTFEDAQIKFWASIHNVWPLAHKCPVALPFFSDFNQGYGKNVFIDGDLVSNAPWSNISCQTLQPLLEGALDSSFEVCVRSVDPVYNGGSSLRFLGKLKFLEFRITKLYAANLELVKPRLFIDFSFLSKSNSIFYLVLKFKGVKGSCIVFLSNQLSDEHHETTKQGSSFTLCKPTSKKSFTKWTVSEFQIEVEAGAVVTDIYGLSTLQDEALNFKDIAELLVTKETSGAKQWFNSPSDRKLLQDTYEVHLGHLRITDDSPSNPASSPKVSNFRAEDLKWTSGGNDRTVSLTLKWDGLRVDGCNVYVEGIEKTAKLLGAAFGNAFYVDSLVIAGGTSKVVFRLQPRNAAGNYVSMDETPNLTIGLC